MQALIAPQPPQPQQQQIQNEWYCSITLEIMKDPVIAEDGHTYERSSITKWFETSNLSPKSGAPMRSTRLIPNLALRNTIQDFLSRGPVRSLSGAVGQATFVNAPLTLKTNLFVSPHDGQKFLLMKVSAPQEGNRQPICIIAIVDNSGSMGESAEPAGEAFGYSRLDLVKHAIRTFAALLGDEDLIGIVSFSTTAKTVMRPTKMTDEGRSKVNVALDSIQPDSQTNIYEGIHMALDLVNVDELKDHHIACVLLTDGFPNISPPRGIVQTLSSFPQKNKITLHASGFGSQLDSVLLSEIAGWGGGISGFIPDCTMVGTVFINLISTLLATAATDATITYTNAGHPFQIKTGPIQFGQSRDFIVSVSSDEVKCSLNGQPDVLATLEPYSASVDFEYVRYQYIQLLHYGIQNAKNGKYKDALHPLLKLADLYGSSSDPRIAALMKDIISDNENEGQVSSALTEKYFNTWGGHYLRAYKRSQELQECMNFKDPGLQIYGQAKLFKEIQTAADAIFCNLPAPKPSRAPTTAYGVPSVVNSPPMSMASFYNSGGGCFGPDSPVLLGDGVSRKTISTLVAGDSVWTPNGPQAITAVCVFGSSAITQLMCQFGECMITPWHPVCKPELSTPQNQKNTKSWMFPLHLTPPKELQVSTVYNLVLPAGHIVDVDGILACTLGHGIKGNGIIEHEFFGTQAVIDALKTCPGWAEGRPTYTNLKGIKKDGVIVGWSDDV